MRNVIFVNSGEEPFTCCHCDISFAQSKDIEAHILENCEAANEKHDNPVYVCDQCGYSCINSKKECTQRNTTRKVRGIATSVAIPP